MNKNLIKKEENIKKWWNEIISGTKKMFKEFFNKETNKKQRANMWTFTRLVITIPVLVFSILSFIGFSTPLLITNSILVAFGALTDYFDGKSARKYNSTSEYGKKLDQLTDKIFSIVVGGTLSYINPLFLISLLGEGVIALSALSFSIKHKTSKDTSTLIGRIKQWPLGASFILGYLAPLNSIINTTTIILILTTSLLQAATTVSYIKRNIEQTNELKNKENNLLLETIEDFEKNNSLGKNIEAKNSNITNDNITKEDIKIELKKLRDELIEEKKISEENNIQKKK